MSQSAESEDGAQRSVAELLARYGGPSPTGGRRRRRAPDSGETAPQSIIERAGPAPQPAAWSQRPGRRRAPEAPEPADLAVPPEPPEPAEPSDLAEPPRLRAAADPPFPRSGPYRSSLSSYPPPGNGRHGSGRDGDSGSSTEQLPRIEAGPVVNGSGAQLTSIVAPAADQAPAGLPAVDEAPAGLPAVDEPPDEPPAGLAGPARDGDDNSDTRDHEPTSAVREWAVVTGQVGAGVVGGAVLWLACEWLWQAIPVLALIVALVVITGLVWVVRRVRRADDLQTTVVAVLVGLFVTVSPAALLLVGH